MNFRKIFPSKRSHETPLHLAILNNRLKEIEHFYETDQWTQTKNSLGLLPLELAQFLGKKEAIKILQPDEASRVIRVVHPEETEIKEYSEEGFEEDAGTRYFSHLYFANYESLKEVIHNCSILLKRSFLGEENRQLGILHQKNLRAGFMANVRIQWIDKEMGYGLFANEDLPTNSLIGEYTGLVRRFSRLRPDPNAYCFHYPTRWWSLKYYMIDALGGGNEMRFANHSDRPNLVPKCLVDRDLLHLVFFTKEAIPAGTELTFDYGKDYWRHRKKRLEKQSFTQ